MTNTNDERILKLRAGIAKKKEELGKISRFTPVTNCSIEIDGQRFNIHTLQKEQLTTLLVKLNTYLLSAKDLEMELTFEISGFLVTDWMDDVKSKLDILSKKDKEKELKAQEELLSQLLSERKKVELQLDAIESMLNDED